MSFIILDTKKRTYYISCFAQKKKELEVLNLYSSKIKTVAIKMRICNKFCSNQPKLTTKKPQGKSLRFFLRRPRSRHCSILFEPLRVF